MPTKYRPDSPSALRRKETRIKARAGDPEAQATVAKWAEVVRLAREKMGKEKLRQYDRAYRERTGSRNRKSRVTSRADTQLAAAGDQAAVERVGKRRAAANTRAVRLYRSKGGLPLAEYREKQQAAKLPEAVIAERARAGKRESARNYRAYLKAGVEAGDTQIIAEHQAYLANMREAQAKHRAKKKLEQAQAA